MHIVYLHGFLSSPESYKAQATDKWLQVHHPQVTFVCPELSSYPDEAKAKIDALFSTLDPLTTYVIGSSLGGYWSSYVIEQEMASKAVVINPAVSPHLRFQHYIGRPLRSYYSEVYYQLQEVHLQQLCDYETKILRDPERYWLMVQQGDEVLDYRLAVEHYKHCKQLIEPGGNHSFENYERWLPDIFQFFKCL